MKTPLSATLLVLALSTGTLAQETHPPQPQSTPAVPDGRFAVLRSEGWGETYRLDRITGEVWQLRQSTSKFSGERRVWRPIPPPEDEPEEAGVHYELSTSRGEGTFLLNVRTGATWALRTVSRELRWEAVVVER